MNFIAIDFETANHNRSSACQIGLAKVVDNEIIERKSYYIKPTPNYYESINKRIHKIDESLTNDKPTFNELWESELKDYFSGFDLVAHNAPFEKSVFNALGELYDLQLPEMIYCSLAISRYYFPELIDYRLDTICKALNIELGTHHNAEDDAVGSANIILALAYKYDLNRLSDFDWSYSSGSHRKGNDGKTLFASETEKYTADENIVKGKAFCITGKLAYIRRDVAAEVIQKAGGIYSKSLTKKVNYLIVGDLSLFGDNYESQKIKKVKALKDSGLDIEILTEQQFQEIVIYEGKKITKQMVETDSDVFLSANRVDMLYDKNVYISEGFSKEIIYDKLPYLGVHFASNHYDEDVIKTDYYFISNQVYNDIFENNLKSSTVVKIEAAMNEQTNPESNPDKHYVKFISEDALNIYLKKVDDYRKGLIKMKLVDWEEPGYVGHKINKR